MCYGLDFCLVFEMHMIVVYLDGFHSMEVGFVLPKCFANGWMNGGVFCKMIRGVGC